MSEHAWLVADIGGTHARLALVEPAARGFAVRERREFATAEYDSLERVIEHYLKALTGFEIEAACLAVAGPVQAGEAKLTNGTWLVSAEAVRKRFHIDPVLVVNDFHAVAASLPELRGGDLLPVGGANEAVANAPKVALGPGTGLGMAALVPGAGGPAAGGPAAGDWRVIALEGGHAALAPADELELEVTRLLLAKLGFVTWEHVLSGPGLQNLHQAVSALWGASADALGAAEITAQALQHEPVCHQTLELFCSMLGTAAGSLAYTFCAQGGVYLAGGILPRIPQFLAASHFRQRFDTVGGASNYLGATPTLLVLTPDVGLVGAAAALARRPR